MDQSFNYELILWNSLRGGSEQAFTSLYNLYYKTLYNYGRKINANADAVEDAIGDLFVDLWQKRSTLSEVAFPKYYLFKALRRRLIKNLEDAAHAIDIDAYLQINYDGDSVASTESHVIGEEDIVNRVNKIKSLLQNLPPRQYEALMLRYYEGFSFEQIADIMKINSQTVRNLAQRGIIHLRQYADIFFSSFVASIFL